MTQRFLILTIDTIAELLKDYVTEEDLPSDAMPVKLLLNTSNQGKLALEFVSDSFKSGAAPLAVHFDIKRVYGL